MEEQWFAILKKCYLMAGVPDEAIRDILQFGELVVLLPDEFLIRKDDHASDLFIVLEGKVNVYTPDGDKITDVGPGGVVGEVALIDNLPRSADAVCIGMVRAAKFPADQLRRYMVEHKDVGFTILANLARVLCARVRKSDQLITELYRKAEDYWKGEH